MVSVPAKVDLYPGRLYNIHMLNWIDNLLNRITMYRLMLYFLLCIAGLAVLLSFADSIMYGSFDIFSFGPLDLAFSVVVLTVACLVVNKFFAWIFKAPVNEESSYITALILSLIITPPSRPSEYLPSLGLLGAVAAIAMASKYIFAFRHRHIFNPAAFAVAVTGISLGYYASWWAGNIYLLPLIIIGGLLVTRKIQRWEMTLLFIAAVVVTVFYSIGNNWASVLSLRSLFTYSPLLFFLFVMFPEPLTSPLSRWGRLVYAVLIGFLFTRPVYIGGIYISPEIALLIGNAWAFAISPKGRYRLTLSRKNEIAAGTHEFVFNSDYRVPFKAGQYLEWTLGQSRPDTRGNRRYFTIASSPTEKEIILATKFYENPSTFKTRLGSLSVGESLTASHQSGEFTLPDDKGKKLAFIAGGIGISPFRSMVKQMIDANEQRNAVLFYSSKNDAEIAYRDIFTQAQTQGLKTVYVLSEQTGPLTAQKIQEEAPDFKERTFYISGPRGMVVAFEKSLKDLGVPKNQIKIDFFPGYV